MVGYGGPAVDLHLDLDADADADAVLGAAIELMDEGTLMFKDVRTPADEDADGDGVIVAVTVSYTVPETKFV